MNICTRTHEECQQCFANCDYKINQTRIAINISRLSVDLIRAVEYNDENYISMNLDKIISSARYFKDTFNV